MDSSASVVASDGDSRAEITRVRILAYLGQLKQGEYVSAKKIVYDLDLRFTTAKNTLEMLEERGYVEKQRAIKRNLVAMFRLAQDAFTMQTTPDGNKVRVPFVPPEWEEAYGRHPYAP